MTASVVQSSGFVQFLKDLAGRVGSTFAQVVLVSVLAGGTASILDGGTWKVAIPVALFSAAATVVSSVILYLTGLQFKPIPDLIRRVVVTFLTTFAGTLTAAGVSNAFDADWKGAAALALPVAGVALAKGLLGLLDKTTQGAALSVQGLVHTNPFTTGLSVPPGDHTNPKSF